ncbi:MAG: hypothetical protein IPJ43_21520 [Saprospiraceae bacterium]|nr:hypothetical protein [Saprospiraceae bacterium]
METNPVIVVIHVFHVAMVVKIYVASVKMTLGLLKYFLKKLPSLKVYQESNFILYEVRSGRKTGYLGLDNNGNFIQTKVKKPREPIVNPGDDCYKCTMQGKIKVCEFYPCKK